MKVFHVFLIRCSFVIIALQQKPIFHTLFIFLSFLLHCSKSQSFIHCCKLTWLSCQPTNDGVSSCDLLIKRSSLRGALWVTSGLSLTCQLLASIGLIKNILVKRHSVKLINLLLVQFILAGVLRVTYVLALLYANSIGLHKVNLVLIKYHNKNILLI